MCVQLEKKGGVPAFIRKGERIGGICVVEGEVGFSRGWFLAETPVEVTAVVVEEVEEEEKGRNPLVERWKRARASMVAFGRQGARYISRVCQHARTGQGTETKRDG